MKNKNKNWSEKSGKVQRTFFLISRALALRKFLFQHAQKISIIPNKCCFICSYHYHWLLSRRQGIPNKKNSIKQLRTIAYNAIIRTAFDKSCTSFREINAIWFFHSHFFFFSSIACLFVFGFMREGWKKMRANINLNIKFPSQTSKFIFISKHFTVRMVTAESKQHIQYA